MRNDTTGGEAAPGDVLRLEMGVEIGKRARGLFPHGVLVETGELVRALEATERLLSDPRVSVIFEGAFSAEDFVARADVLEREGDGWHVIEVKSSVNLADDHIYDLMYTVGVLQRAGLDVARCSLMLVCKDYRLGSPNSDLFKTVEVTDEVFGLLAAHEGIWARIAAATGAGNRPNPSLTWQCRHCDQFDECTGHDIENHIFDLPRLRQEMFEELKAAGAVRIEDMPATVPLTALQARMKEVTLSGEPFVGPGLVVDLAQVRWPAFYLDFETVMTAIPLYPGVAPYVQIPTQYSIHVCSEPGVVQSHREYLADPRRDCRRQLAERLVEDLAGEGSIITYSPFEKTRINQLARDFPDLAPDLHALGARTYDLAKVIRDNYYHPDFHGSFSIKKVLPALVDMTYDGMPIGDGDAAVAVFARMALGRCTEEEEGTYKKHLLEYCKQDTLAMVKLHERLHLCLAT